MKKIFRFFIHPLFLAVIGLIALAAIIWFVGPLIAVGKWRPLELPAVRWALIAVIVLAWLLKQLWSWWSVKRANNQMLDSLLEKGPEKEARPSASDEEIAVLNQRFDEAIGILRQARLNAAGRKPGPGDVLSLTGKQYLYQLPWYLFIGAPGSGKTTALVNSGLKFPLAEKFGTASVRGVGGTRNCDWWFTDEAVLLDTAGRYTTQESDRHADSVAWQGFLQLLKKHRPRRPINGVIVTVSVSDLLQQSAQERESQAAAIRARLKELHDHFQIGFPTYVLVTKTDLLAGFTDFFNDLGKEERAQVWGMTFSYSEEEQTEALPNFATEYQLLEKRILDRVLERMQAERDPAKRAQIFAFPQQFVTLRPLLTAFLDRVFIVSRYEERPLVRGVYFTSGTQEGSPIDRVMGQLARALGLERKLLPPQAASGRSFFVTSLFHRVIFPEQGLAGTNLRWEHRRAYLRWGAYAAGLMVAIGLSALWLNTYFRNRAYVDEVEAKVPGVKKQVETLAVTESTNVLGLLPVMNSVRDLAVTPELDRAKPPLGLGFGLFQGKKLGAASDQTYHHLLEDAFLPRLAMRIEEQLRSAQGNDLEFAYEALKAYLMVHDTSHFDPTALKAWVDLDWENALPRDFPIESRRELDSHLTALFERGAVTSPLPPDQRLVSSVRSTLTQYPLGNRIYSRLKRVGVANQVPEFTIAKAAGPSAPLVFARASGAPLTKGIPGLFTYDGYYKLFLKESEKAARQLAEEESWVIGMEGGHQTDFLKDPQALARLDQDIRRLYLTDYANLWQDFLNDIRLVRSSGLQQSIDIARRLSAPDSPLPPLLRAVAHETTLTRAEPQKGLVDKGMDQLKEKEKSLRSLFGGQESAPAAAAGEGQPALEAIVDDRFADIRRLVTSPGPNQPAPIDTSITLLNEIYTHLIAIDTALKDKTTPPSADVLNKVKAEAARMPEPVRSIMQTLSSASAAQGAVAMRDTISANLASAVGNFCKQAIGGRYPFVHSSRADVTPDDFAKLFGPGGLMDEFFQKNLASIVDTTGRQWTFKSIHQAPIGEAGNLVQFQRAQVIREVFFRNGSRTPSIRLDFKPLTMDASITQFTIDVDGQQVKYSHDQPVLQPVQWPGLRGSNMVRVQVEPPSGVGLSSVTTEGPWALFRLFDRMRVARTSQPERFRVAFSVDGRNAEFEVLAAGVQNPYRLKELEQFQCPGHL